LSDHEAIADAGRYQLQAAMVACHAEAARWEDTDWTQILVLFDMFLHLAPSPVTRLHRVIALRYVSGPAAALREVDLLAGDLDSYYLFHAARAELFRDLDPAEQSLLHQRLNWT
jgi:predicted RNA polymerase sigma factor